jgi:hypothetical protein
MHEFGNATPVYTATTGRGFVAVVFWRRPRIRSVGHHSVPWRYHAMLKLTTSMSIVTLPESCHLPTQIQSFSAR